MIVIVIWLPGHQFNGLIKFLCVFREIPGLGLPEPGSEPMTPLRSRDPFLNRVVYQAF